MTETVGTRIKAAREAANLSQTAFADRLLAYMKRTNPQATLTRGAVGNWELGKGVSHSHIVAIAEAFHLNLDWLARGAGTYEARPQQSAHTFRESTFAPVKSTVGLSIEATKFIVAGTAEAGKFFPMDDIQIDPDLPLSVTGDRSERFPNVTHLAFQVKGDSMDKAGIHHGDFVLAVDWFETGLSMESESGCIVVVERTLFDGQARELTVKYLEVRQDAFLLHPRSSNPKHKSIIVPRGAEDDGTEVRIRALVVGVTRSLEQKRWIPQEV